MHCRNVVIADILVFVTNVMIKMMLELIPHTEVHITALSQCRNAAIITDHNFTGQQ